MSSHSTMVVRASAEVSGTALRIVAPAAQPVSGDDIGKRLHRHIWQFGIDWLCEAVDASAVGVLVVRRATAGDQIVGNLGCPALAHAAMLHRLSEPSTGWSRSFTTAGWSRLAHASETALPGASAEPGERWAYQLPNSGDLDVYVGVQTRRPQTPESLRQLTMHVSRLGQALATELSPRARGSAEASPVDMAMEAVNDVGLTLAEKEVLRELLTGTPAKRIATRRDVSVSTVRTQIKSVYGKLNVSRASQIYGRLHQLGETMAQRSKASAAVVCLPCRTGL